MLSLPGVFASGIQDAHSAFRRRGEMRICFIKITPEPLVRTYMVGYGVWELRSRMESGAAKVVIGRAPAP